MCSNHPLPFYHLHRADIRLQPVRIFYYGTNLVSAASITKGNDLDNSKHIKATQDKGNR